MAKRVLCTILAVVMLLGLILGICGSALAALAAETDQAVIKLHYNRPDGNYDTWTVWFWNLNADGVSVDFKEEGGDMVATFPVEPGVTSVGYIVRKGNWEAKDVSEDQFIDMGDILSGTLHVYVESGVKGHKTVDGNDIKRGVKLTNVKYDGESVITVNTTGPLTNFTNAFTLKTGGETVAIASVTPVSDKTYKITPAEPLIDTASYTLVFDNTDYKVTMPIVFSTDKFEAANTYTGNDLGATWTVDSTAFRVWAPTANAVSVKLYKSGTHGTNDLIAQHPMTKDVNGTWIVTVNGNLNGTYYTYEVDLGGSLVEACDTYARTTGVNGKRAMVIDLDSTDPEGWAEDKDPNAGNKITDNVIYELHIRDLSTDSNSGIVNVGKYLGVVEPGTKTPSGIPTGLDHMKDLGITHLHILPMYDYGSVDESKLDTPQFNWGYDPVNYNVPEGSYSTDPYDGAVRVREVKQMVKALHDNGISVIMDVVYNHVYNAHEFCFNKIVPMYFSRVSENGVLSSGSGCGNDTASERSMVKKYIVDSVKYWADEYHIDGFRFDLVGLIDTETINAIVEEVHKTHPNVIFYGEGWTMTTSVTKPGYTMTTQTNSTKTPEFAFFSDTFRDMLKGSVFENTAKGFISGANGYESKAQSAWMGKNSWSTNPSQIVNYASCHDNMTLFDRVVNSTKGASLADQIKMNNLAAAMTMTSQGIPFLQAGEELLRTKVKPDGSFDHNSYSSPDSINSIKWGTLDDASYQSVYNYYKGLIAFRKAHPALRLSSAAEVNQYVTTVSTGTSNCVAFQIKGGQEGERAKNIFLVFNANTTAAQITLPEGEWNVYVQGDKAGTQVLGTATGSVSVEPISSLILVQEDPIEDNIGGGASAGLGTGAIIAIAAVVVALVIGGVILAMHLMKNHA